MKYKSTELNGWDYVLAITQSQVNNGLQHVYSQGGLPKNFDRTEKLMEMEVAIKGEFGSPVIIAIKDGLKLCHLIIPIQGLSFFVGGSEIPFNKDLNLVISTSLANMESEIEDEDQDGSYEIYIDLKSSDAIYKVDIDGDESDEIRYLEELLELELKSFNNNRYQIASVPIPKEADDYMPQLIDYSFTLKSNGTDEPTFLLCCARNEGGPTTENRLVFAPTILPSNLPAALWVGKELVLGKVVLEMMNGALQQKYPEAKMIYDGKNKVTINDKFEMGKVDGDHPTRMDRFDIYPKEGNLAMDVETTIREITFMKFSAIGKVRSHISIALKGENTFELKSEIIEKDADLKGIPTPIKIVIGFLSVGLVPFVLFISEIIMEKTAETNVANESGNSMKDRLSGMVNKVNLNLDKIPSLQELSVNGHLLFDGVELHENGNFIFGIKGMHND